MRTWIRNATILTLNGGANQDMRGDILIEGDTISAIGSISPPEQPYLELDARDRLVMPGLVNAHLHSSEALLKGRYDNLPFDTWGLYVYPVLGETELSPELIYLRTVLVGMEALKNGVTMVLDDVADEVLGQRLESLEAIFQAYDDLGLRANCSGNIMDKYQIDALPYAAEVIPPDVYQELRSFPLPGLDDYLGFSREVIRRFHGRSGRLRYVVAPVAPQWCSDELLEATAQLAEDHDLNYHIHVQETKHQLLAAHLRHAKTFVAHLSELGVLSSRTTLAHAVWVTHDDLALLAAADSAIVHNPIANLKLGVGIAPFRKFLDFRIPVGLGTDGLASNDSARMFDVIRLTALLHRISVTDSEAWPTAPEVLRAATIGGAQATSLGKATGTLEVGKKADLIVMKMDGVEFTPVNDLRQHLVFCESGSSIETVIVGGEVVVRNGSIVGVDEDALLAELRRAAPVFQKRQEEVEKANRRFEPYLREIERRCMATPMNVNRYAIA